MCRFSVIIVIFLLDALVFSSFSRLFVWPFTVEKAIALSIQPQREYIGRSQEWDVARIGKGNKCKISNSISNREKGREFLDPVVVVTVNFRRHYKDRNFKESDEVLVLPGDFFHTEGTYANVTTIDIDGEQFLLATDGTPKKKAMIAGTYLFAEEPELAAGEALVNAMMVGYVMTVTEVTDAGNVVERTLSLLGFTKAYRAALEACPRWNK